MISRGVVLLAFALAAPATVAGQTRLLADMSAEERERRTGSPEPPPYPTCSVTSDVPAPGAVIDLDTVLAAARTAADGHILFTVRVDSAGMHARRIDGDVEGEPAGAIEDAVQRSFRTDAPTTRSAFRIRVDTGPDAEIRPAASVACIPYLLNRDEIARELVRRAGNRRAWSDRRFPRSVTVMARVGVDGDVLEVRLRTSVGDLELDRTIADLFRVRARFGPAMLDGEPREVWASIPVAIGSAR